MKLKTVCLVLGLCHAGFAAALGLGELNVRSYLGQPLHATVKIIGANAATQADCFSLTPSTNSAAPPPPRAQLTLERRGDDAFLHIRTAIAVGDPIAQFSLTSDCESRLQRDYVVLLDPPLSATLARGQNVPVVIPLKASADDSTQTATAPAAPPARERPTRKSARSAPSTPPTARESDVKSRKRTAQPEPAARLVLSGRHGLQTGALALQLDTTLPDLNRPRPANLTPDELSDENTALTRKLAHLESQLQELNTRNAELEARREQTPVRQSTPTITDRLPQWPLYLLIVVLLIATTGVLVWLLRRRRVLTGMLATDRGDPMSPTADVDSMTADPWTTRPHGAAPKTESPADVKAAPIVEFEPSATSQTTEVNDDILDQAEVYMAHGHGDLAIHLLQEHLRAAPDESPVPWLLLLDLLQREGDTAGYAAASTECRRYFNINLSGQGVSQDSDSGYGIEAYPHILEQLMNVWGTPESDDFFEDLIFDRRGGTRIGFEPSAYREILLLRTIAEER